jgi:hypothetical protein
MQLLTPNLSRGAILAGEAAGERLLSRDQAYSSAR